jgi:hypothetical protein
MPDKRHRMIFDCPEVIQRAVKLRAALEGTSVSEVIMDALEAWIPDEIKQVLESMYPDEFPPEAKARHKRKPRK